MNRQVSNAGKKEEGMMGLWIQAMCFRNNFSNPLAVVIS